MPRLTVEAPEEMKSKAFELLEKKVTVGAEEENAICLQHPSVSKCHLELSWVDGDYQMKDLGSTNGSYINGEVKTEGILRNGDHLQTGEVVLLYESDVVPGETTQPKEDHFTVRPKLAEPKDMVIERKIPDEEITIKINALPPQEPKKEKWTDVGTSATMVVLLFVFAFGIGAGVFYLLHILL